MIVAEPRSASLRSLLRSDDDIIVWWFSEIECASALARLERDRHLAARAAQELFTQLDAFRTTWATIEAIPAIRRHAWRLLRVHRLRAADAGQLAAALVAAEGHNETLEFVSLDDRLLAAAEREGFVVPQFDV